MAVKDLLPLFHQFKQEIQSNPTKAQQTLAQLKKHFVSFKTFLPTQDYTKLDDESKNEIMLVRETLEYAILFSAQIKDLSGFERHVAQVKTYYNHNFVGVEKSAREPLILGLNLLRLLAQNRIAEFHTELELIPVEFHNNMYIKHPIDLELYLMEGSYNKLRNARQQVPADQYIVFMDILMETVREEIADCSEKAYNSLKLEAVQKLLLFKTMEETKAYIAKRNWKVQNGEVIFEKEDHTAVSFEENSRKLIDQMLTYAKEMSRII